MVRRANQGYFAGGRQTKKGGRFLSFPRAIQSLFWFLVCLVSGVLAQGEGLKDAQAFVESRYGDSHWMDYIHQCDRSEGISQLRQICGLIAERYYPLPDIKAVVERAIMQLAAAAESPFVQAQYVPLDEGEIQLFQKQIHQIQCELSERREPLQAEELEQTACDIVDRLEPYATRAGLDSSWLSIELSCALASSLDPYSDVFSPGQYQALRDRLKGGYAGIGVDLILIDERPVLYDVLPGCPAAHAGIQPGSVVMQLHGQDTFGLTFPKIQELMSGPAGSRICLKVQDGQKETRYNLTREILDGITVRYIQKLQNTETGFMRISGFDRDTAMEIRRGLNELERLSVTSLILDLRDNGGGIMSSAIDAVKLFLAEGQIVSVHSREKEVEYQAESNGMPVCTLPLVLLVNEHTASAAEIFAAALQDHHRASLVGNSTMGKTQIQTIYQLHPGRIALCLTTGCYLRPESKRKSLQVVEPDVKVLHPFNASPNTMAYYLTAEDQTLKQAMKLLQSDKKSLLVSIF